MTREQKKLKHLNPLLKFLTLYDFAGYVRPSSKGDLIITIPGLAPVYPKIKEDKEKEG